MKVSILFLLILLLNISLYSQNLTQSTSLVYEAGHDLTVCGTNEPGVANRYIRFFKLSDYGITNDYQLAFVQYFVHFDQNNYPGGNPVTTKVYKTMETTFNPFFRQTSVLIDSIAFLVTAQQGSTPELLSIPVSGIVPVGYNLVVEAIIDMPAADGFEDVIALGGNSLGQSASVWYNLDSVCSEMYPGFSPENNYTLCMDSISLEYWILNIVGNGLRLNENVQSCPFSISPNPVTDILKINLFTTPDSKNSYFRLYNATGQSVISVRIETDEFLTDMSDFPKGIYFYNIILGEEIRSGKIVIQK